MGKRDQVRRQEEGHRRIRMGKISSRPTIMVTDSTALDRAENSAKLPTGPIYCRPGPTLLRQVRAAEKETEKDTSSRETISPAPSSTRK